MAFLRAFGSYAPARVVDNSELGARLQCDESWILSASGIEQRRYADSTESVVDLGVNAANDCLSRGVVPRETIGLILVSCGSAGRRFPGPAAEIGTKLGLNGIPAIDLPLASAGSIFGMTLGAQLADIYGGVLLIATEKMSSVIENAPLDKNTAILFGDGAGACLIEAKEGVAKIGRAILHSDGANAQNLRLDFNSGIHMDGGVVIRHASQKIPGVIVEALTANGVSGPAISQFLMHQANQNLIDRVAKSLEVEPGKFYSNIARYGNTSSASMLIAAAEWSASSGFHKDEHVVFAGFGAGFHWGALLATGV